ncbi:hypothetical protein BDI4_430078 [Burkholderia diffusa]|nr:hypothetical protein BDI4_430078 [Burkholderia diffusa]
MSFSCLSCVGILKLRYAGCRHFCFHSPHFSQIRNATPFSIGVSAHADGARGADIAQPRATGLERFAADFPHDEIASVGRTPHLRPAIRPTRNSYIRHKTFDA